MEQTTAMDAEIQNFWKWFAANQSKFKTLVTPDEPFWDVALEQLKKVDKRFWMELSSEDEGAREFVVTAEGDVEVFPAVEALINAAPVMEGWKFVALKPPMGFTFTTRYEGVLFDPQRMWFLPLDIRDRALDLGLRVGIEGLIPADEPVAHNALLVILDTGLGERSAALDVQYIEVGELPSEPEAAGYIELPELAEYIAWRKKKKLSSRLN